MVSAVHPGRLSPLDFAKLLQRGCTWLVQFICIIFLSQGFQVKLQRGYTWLVQFIAAVRDWNGGGIDGFKGAAHG